MNSLNEHPEPGWGGKEYLIQNPPLRGGNPWEAGGGVDCAGRLIFPISALDASRGNPGSREVK